MKKSTLLLPLAAFILCADILTAQQAPPSSSNCPNSTVWNGSSWNPQVPDSGSLAIFTSNYNSVANLSACAVRIENGAVVTFKENAQSGHTLTIENEFQIVDGALVFENNAALVQINDVSNIGSITYQRRTKAISEYDFTYWSAPVTNQTLFGLSPNTRFDKYMEFNATANSWNVILNGAQEMLPGRGYIVRGPEDQVEFEMFNGIFNGEPNNGNVSIETAGNGNYNLIGNPYPSAINADCFISDNANASINGALYFWTHNVPIANTNTGPESLNYNISDYAVYNLLGGVGTGVTLGASNQITTVRPTGMIAAGVGFFVKGLSTGTATFKNSMRVSSNNGQNSQFFRSSNSATPTDCAVEKSRLWLQIERPGVGATPIMFKQVLIGYAAGATTSATLDRDFDAEVLSTDTAIGLYSLSPSNTPLTIQGRDISGINDPNEVVPLVVKCPASPSIKISVSEDDGIFDERVYFLRELISGSGPTAVYQYHDIKNNPLIFSTATDIDTETRFQFVFAKAGPPIKPSICGTTLAKIYSTVSAVSSMGASEYRFKVTNLNNPIEVQYLISTDNSFQMTELASHEYDTTYRIEVATKIAGLYGNYGPSCEVATPSLFSGPAAIVIPQCGTTLQNSYSPIFITGPSAITEIRIHVQKLDSGGNVVSENTIDRTVPWFKLSQLGLSAYGTTYNVRVAVKTTGSFSAFTNPCTITTPAAPTTRMSSSASIGFGADAYPNPFSESFAINVINSGKAEINLKVYDLLGRLLEERNVTPTDLNSQQFGSGLPSGVYNVLLSQDDALIALKVIKR